VFSFGQISPLKKGAGEKGKFFFFYYKRERERERERESEFTQENGWNFLSLMAIILPFLGGRCQGGFGGICLNNESVRKYILLARFQPHI
jgi:hypothetical protein